MAPIDLSEHLDSSTSRRKIVTTGAKVAYAAPVVAASFKLSQAGAGAVSANAPCETFVCGNGLCVGEFSDPIEERCACFELVESPGNGLCLGDFYCGEVSSCTSDDDCGGGHCVTNTCCGQGVQLCAPPCRGGVKGIRAQGAGPTASGA